MFAFDSYHFASMNKKKKNRANRKKLDITYVDNKFEKNE